MVIAKYIRLSMEDDGVGESESVGNQRLLLDEFLRTHSEFSDDIQEEFVDDGFSGVTMNRPSLKKLLDKVRFRSVQCIIVKDFSRFSRNYLDLGRFLETIFPVLGIRFISVNDHYDSKTYSLNQGLELPFKGIMNDWYSRDLSRKITSAKRELMRCGQMKIGMAIYGYKKDPDHKMPYVVDEPAAEVVRQIFVWAKEGISAPAIAQSLTARQVLTPALYKKSRGFAVGEPKYGNVWNAGKVNEILKDERYTGEWILGKYGTDGIRSPVKKDSSQWYRFPLAAEPIVSKKLYQQVQQIRSERIPHNNRKKGKHLFYQKILCSCCGRHLYRRQAYKTERASYFCRTAVEKKGCGCFQGHIQEREIKVAVWNLMKFSTFFCDIKKCRQNYDRWQESMIKKKSMAYEQWKAGKMEQTEFIQLKNRLTVTKEEETDCRIHLTKDQQLKREEIDKIIDRIFVFHQDRIIIHLKAGDPFLV